MDNMPIGSLIPPDLMKAIDQMYPPRPPHHLDSEREIWMKAGERRLVEVLLSKFNEATEGVLHV